MYTSMALFYEDVKRPGATEEVEKEDATEEGGQAPAIE